MTGSYQKKVIQELKPVNDKIRVESNPGLKKKASANDQRPSTSTTNERPLSSTTTSTGSLSASLATAQPSSPTKSYLTQFPVVGKSNTTASMALTASNRKEILNSISKVSHSSEPKMASAASAAVASMATRESKGMAM